ncbi:hypothetical protein LCGC14_0538180 [marine sediment metagenome]|uniref:Uncharacterized protein n=1 Tax=marine sediment metagenome TaxID=412755 RepID=A0A0F9RTQ2_9ZZZZ|nr:hypothetical protein [bacterium]
MNLTKALTPKNTEEIKPGLFIQARAKNPDTIEYRQVSPAAWEGKIIWKNLLFGQGFLKSFLFFLIIIFLAWSYFHDVKVYQDFYEEVISNPVGFCTNVSLVNINGEEITNSLQSDFG